MLYFFISSQRVKRGGIKHVRKIDAVLPYMVYHVPSRDASIVNKEAWLDKRSILSVRKASNYTRYSYFYRVSQCVLVLKRIVFNYICHVGNERPNVHSVLRKTRMYWRKQASMR